MRESGCIPSGDRLEAGDPREDKPVRSSRSWIIRASYVFVETV